MMEHLFEFLSEGESKRLHQCPSCSYNALTLFSLTVSLHEAENKMSAQNLGIVFGPNIMRSKGNSVDFSATSYQSTAAYTLVECFNYIFRGGVHHTITHTHTLSHSHVLTTTHNKELPKPPEEVPRVAPPPAAEVPPPPKVPKNSIEDFRQYVEKALSPTLEVKVASAATYTTFMKTGKCAVNSQYLFTC